jgi:hypothetical protein
VSISFDDRLRSLTLCAPASVAQALQEALTRRVIAARDPVDVAKVILDGTVSHHKSATDDEAAYSYQTSTITLLRLKIIEKRSQSDIADYASRPCNRWR